MGKKAEASGVRVPGPNVFIQAVKSEHLPSLSPPNDTFFEKVKERFLRWMRTPWQEKLRGTQKWGPACLLFA